MDVWTYRYKFVHGKEPRGYGWWWFENYDRQWSFNGWGKYSDVKRDAIKEAKKDGIEAIYTAP